MAISSPSTNSEEFGLCHVRPTTVRDLRLVVTTLSLREPQTMIRIG
jgi:hypothetical protein